MNPPQPAASRLWLILLLLLALLVIAGQLGYRWLQGDANPTFSNIAPCDLVQGCAAHNGEQRLSLRFESPPDSHQAFVAALELQGVDPTAVTLELQGMEMFMGLNRYPMTRDDNGRYRARVQLPVCTTGRMQWRARVLLEQSGTSEFAEFTFWAK